MENLAVKIDEIKEKLTSQEYLDLMTELQKAHSVQKPDVVGVLGEINSVAESLCRCSPVVLAKQIAKFNELLLNHGCEDRLDTYYLSAESLDGLYAVVQREMKTIILRNETIWAKFDELRTSFSEVHKTRHTDVESILWSLENAIKDS